MKQTALCVTIILAVLANPSETNTFQYVTVTQNISRVFGNATDKMIDRIHLCEAAKRQFLDIDRLSGVTNELIGVRVESVSYLASNKVEAVFCRCIKSISETP